jgi:hypothetical protein
LVIDPTNPAASRRAQEIPESFADFVRWGVLLLWRTRVVKEINRTGSRSFALLALVLVAGCGEAQDWDVEARARAVTIPRRLPRQPDTFGATCPMQRFPRRTTRRRR